MGTWKEGKKEISNVPNAPLQGGQNCQLDEGAAETAVSEVLNGGWEFPRRLGYGSLLHFGSDALVRRKEVNAVARHGKSLRSGISFFRGLRMRPLSALTACSLNLKRRHFSSVWS
jgi:hypothetical protein